MSPTAEQASSPGQRKSGSSADYFLKTIRYRSYPAPTSVIGVIRRAGKRRRCGAHQDGTHRPSTITSARSASLPARAATCEPDTLEIRARWQRGRVAVIPRHRQERQTTIPRHQWHRLNCRSIDGRSVTDGPGRVRGPSTFLAPGTKTIQSGHSLFTGPSTRINGPMGTIADTGRQHRGSDERARLRTAPTYSALATLSVPEPMDSVVYQGPGVRVGVE